jgi:hypothetical protein
MSKVQERAPAEFTNTVSITGPSLTYKRKVYNSVAQTDAKTFTTDDSGTLVVLASTAGQIQVFNLPTISKTEQLGTFFDFIVTVSGNSGAAGSYTINTGGNATDLSLAPTQGYDDIIGVLSVVDTSLPAMPADDASNVIPASGEGTLVLADNTSNAVIAVGTHFRLTAVALSTTSASTNVWHIDGTICTSPATGFVTGALFTAP